MEIFQAGGPGVDSPEEIEAARGMHNGGEPVGLPEGPGADQDSIPDVPGSRQAADGKHYVQQGQGWAEVVNPNGAAQWINR